MTLHIAEGLDLPIEAVTETFAILAKRGKGKTNTAVVMAEEMIAAGQPVIIIDPVGVWWGLRSSADGKSDGLPVVILGGDHGDTDLNPAAGALVAETLVASRASAVIDLSVLSKSAARRFAADFIETLYHRNRETLHVIVDEADMFAPQRTASEGARLLGAMEDLVRRGRARGIGVTLITQRPATLNKDVLTQAEVLVALGMTGVRDVAAIDEWVRLHADEDEAKAVKASLPTLQVGEAWFWSPGWLSILQRVKVRRRQTFDSSATPKPGEQRTVASHLAPVDIAALGEQMAAMVEEHTKRDPKVLLARIRELEAIKVAPEIREVEVRVEVPVLPQGWDLALANLADSIADLGDDLKRLEALTNGVTKQVDAKVPVSPSPQVHRISGIKIPRSMVESAPAPRAFVTSTPPPTNGDGPALSKAQRVILTVLATYGTRTKASVATLSGYSAGGGSFANALGSLRSAGYIERGEPISITEAGLAVLGPVDPLPTGAALREHWKANKKSVPGAAAKIIDVLAEAFPASLTAEEIAQATGYAASGGSFANALGRLRSLGLAHGGRDSIVIDEDLM